MALAFKLVGVLITSTHLKNGMTTEDNMGRPVFWVVQYRFVGRVSTYRRIWIFLVIVKSVTADGSLRSPTGGVEGLTLHLIFTNK